MKKKARQKSKFKSLVAPIIGFLLVAAGIAWFFESQSTTTLIVVRHAEKADQPAGDPSLSTQGQLRAQRLANMLVDVDVVAGLDAIYVSQFKRTRETARPIANKLELPIVEWDAEDYKGLEKKILDEHRGQIVLIVGHSNTVPRIIAEFGGSKRIPEIPEQQYNDLFVVSIPWFGRTKTLRLEYGN